MAFEKFLACGGVVLGICVGIFVLGGCGDGELGFELAGDRPIVRWLMFVVAAKSLILVSSQVLSGKTTGGVTCD